MANSGRRNDTHILWGAPLSLYTGKARSYLIKKGLRYRELFPPHADFQTRILPAIGFFVVPVLETPDGTIVQDTTDIIEHLEATVATPRLTPDTPVQRAVAMLIDAFASEALLRTAMHYRWSYRAENEAFLRAEFGRVASASCDNAAREAAAAPFMEAMNAYLPALGITAQTIPAIEESYAALLDILDRHFLQHPYVLGGRPSVADFGLMAPLFAHLARDPYPSALMKSRAPNVFRWTERMNLAGVGDGEFPDIAPEYPEGDAIPATIEPLLALIFRDWGPELQAIAAAYAAWLDRHPDVASGTIVTEGGGRGLHPHLGPAQFELRGRTVTGVAFVHALWHFARAAAEAQALTGDARTRFDTLVRRAGGDEVMAIRLPRALRRENFVPVVA
jgi:glutathione S-transferase